MSTARPALIYAKRPVDHPQPEVPDDETVATPFTFAEPKGNP